MIEGDRKVSFAEFDRDANRIAAAMTGAGVQPGDHQLCALQILTGGWFCILAPLRLVQWLGLSRTI